MIWHVIIYLTSLVEYDVTSGPGRTNIFSKVAKICSNITFRKSPLFWVQNNKLFGISEYFCEIGGHFDPTDLVWLSGDIYIAILAYNSNSDHSIQSKAFLNSDIPHYKTNILAYTL